jgi:sec-independent protein translocase protein TatC
MEDFEKENGLTYFDHLEVLRKKIISIIVVILILTCAAFFFVDKIIYFLKLPISDLKIDLYFFKPQEKFITYLKISFFTSLIFSIPYAIYQIASFIIPALNKKERIYFNIMIFFVLLLFFAGSFFSYRFLTPLVFNFFINFSSDDMIKPLWSMSEYFNLLIMMVLLIGITFEFPLVLLFLIKIGLISVKTLSKYRRHAIVIIFIIAAVITPTVDVFTQCIVAVILYLLFEITVVVGRFVEKKEIDDSECSVSD